MTDRELRLLQQMAREYPTIQAASAEIINLTAILNLPKGTEHFMSDIHGEHEAFLHILNNGSGAVADKIKSALGDSLTIAERRNIAALIYYPKEKLREVKRTETDMDDWYRVTLKRLISVCRQCTTKYSRSKVRKALPKEYAYIMEEMLNTGATPNKEHYYDNIIRAIVDTGSADTMIEEMATLIKRMTVDELHIVGDIFDRGPHADVILDHLMKHHHVDVQWGNHDVLWMGAAAGSPVCVATAVKNCVQYDNLDMLENAYGINLLPLAVFSTERYGDAHVFAPRKLPEELFKPRDTELYSRMHKAISVIMYKLEGQLVHRRKEYGMEDRDMLGRVNWSNGTININGTDYPLRDTDFPTIYPNDPNRLSEDEAALMEQLCTSFMHSEKLQAHARFLCSAGSLYLKRNGNLLFHGCVPTNRDGSFMEFEVGKAVRLSGKEYFDYADRMARQGLLAPEGSKEREDGRDYLWFLWCGRNSPVFGRDHIATFERALIEDKSTWKEPKNHYYSYTDDEEFCRNLLHSFGCDKPWSRIVNGHVPVKAKEGESPLKGHGRLVVIDGGFCKAYQNQTGIAGYTMFFNSLGMRLAAHEPFTSIEDAVKNGRDITSHTFNVDELQHRVMVADIDTGEEIKARIEDLNKLLAAFRDGTIKIDPIKAKQRQQ
jgi:fructose-1,6-bisphosphatase III